MGRDRVSFRIRVKLRVRVGSGLVLGLRLVLGSASALATLYSFDICIRISTFYPWPKLSICRVDCSVNALAKDIQVNFSPQLQLHNIML